jgi:uncharacterized membrane protein HdeD (DUF308 family)
MFTIITLRHSLLRSILGIILGLLFIMWPQESVTYLVITTGIFFILSGVCSFFIWRLRRDKNLHTFSPLLICGVAIGSILLGAWLVFSPGFFVNVFGRIWGAILVIAGIQQLVSLFKAREWCRTPFGYYVLPALILLAGVMILVYPFEAVANIFILLGVVSLFYGVNELISWYKFRPQKVKLAEDEYKAENEAGSEV